MAFERFDLDNNGVLSPMEFCRALHELGFSFSPDEVVDWLEAIDRDQSPISLNPKDSDSSGGGARRSRIEPSLHVAQASFATVSSSGRHQIAFPDFLAFVKSQVCRQRSQPL